MPDQLQEAKIFANKFRYTGDKLVKPDKIDPNLYDKISNNFSQENLLISDALTPSISKSINTVCKRLKMPSGSVQAFVYPSEQLQAHCIEGSLDKTILRFSSHLINLLNKEEIEFVIGHEIGHFLLGHGIINHDQKGAHIQSFMQKRFQEISADRVGLIACKSIDKAINAMLKLSSGLSSKYLRFDISAFISQLDKSKYNFSELNIFSTHPSNLLRCRSLLWFSLTDCVSRGNNYYNKNQMIKLDNRVEQDLNDFVDGPIVEIINDAKKRYKLWVAAERITSDGVFDKKEQAVFLSLFDVGLMDKLVNFIQGLNKSDIQSAIAKKIENSKLEIQYLIPDTCKEETSKIEKDIRSSFN